LHKKIVARLGCLVFFNKVHLHNTLPHILYMRKKNGAASCAYRSVFDHIGVLSEFILIDESQFLRGRSLHDRMNCI